ncbi:hypothetical protein IQ215_09440 [Cyanobacterium stanieri LEGE 03274]|uniref:CopG family transcriptional regulator n=1 Tax=Cyanobacterium stanieri LEGE 03274 TaxID=1828756 RepID=A0ABR9V4U8_9CHRO|nr:hypothetical protein [Cyanobacterium stanieri]MBE9222915.1 hypothetical protein [Cyanobacterium stanieri LEGE 03274]
MTQELNLQTANLYLNIPDEWLEKLDNIAVEKEKNIEQLVIDIIGNYLSNTQHLSENKQILEKYQKLSQRLEVLEKKDHQIERITTKLDILEKLVATLQTKVVKEDNTETNNDNWDDEFEDEPDEVLTDFLL